MIPGRYGTSIDAEVTHKSLNEIDAENANSEFGDAAQFSTVHNAGSNNSKGSSCCVNQNLYSPKNRATETSKSGGKCTS